ncbi:MAG: S8/S53 family peptidase [Micromonosporaceae bacterium]|nr:S8/S53 family peptidase [Micromonosporaceae bacterium]
MRLRPSRLIITSGTLGAILIALPLFGSGVSQAATQRVAVPGATADWSRHATDIGAPSAGTRITVSVALRLRDQAGAERVAADVSDPASPSYRRFLTPAQFTARFAPTADQVAAVRQFLTGQGLTVDTVAAGNEWVQASGTTRQVEKAFDTTLRNYRWNGHQLRAPARMVSIPQSIAAYVAGVTGLDTGTMLRRPTSKLRPDATHPRPLGPVTKGGRNITPDATVPAPQPCSTFWDQHEQVVPAAYGKTRFPTDICGYSPAQIRGAYGVPAGGGSGVTVGILDAFGAATQPADANAFSQHFGEPVFASGQYTQTLNTPFQLQAQCGEAGWNVEQALDIEAVHGVAPAAKIHYFGAQDCDTGIDTALNTIVQGNLVDILSNSWGAQGEAIPQSEITLEHNLFVQAAAQGMGIYFSSGDAGDNSVNGLSPQPDYPASDVDVTSVGGTSLAISSNNTYLFETPWGDVRDGIDYAGTTATYTNPLPGTDFFGGAGGGRSTLSQNAQPAYQMGRVPAALSTVGGVARRVVPDVSAIADPYTGYAIVVTQNGQRLIGAIGGTSLSCPVFAGIQAVASFGTHNAFGFANPLLYRLRATYFHDVHAAPSGTAIATETADRLVTLGLDTSLAGAPGYDAVTGLGSPTGSLIRFEKAGPQVPPVPPSTSPQPTPPVPPSPR